MEMERENLYAARETIQNMGLLLRIILTMAMNYPFLERKILVDANHY